MKIIKEGNATVKVYEGESGGDPLFTVVRIRENFRKLTQAKRRAHKIAIGIERGPR